MADHFTKLRPNTVLDEMLVRGKDETSIVK